MSPAPQDPAGSAPLHDTSDSYRPHLDGLRFVAVYLVVAFHSGVRLLDGGFVGVDVFFVLSGYLVTNVLLRDLAGHGGIRFGRFYARRVRRLLPAAFLALIGTAAVYTALASATETERAASAIRACFLYWANWHFISESADYFGDVDRNPVLHFWSLAVEEQFYVLWPLLLAGLVAVATRFGRHRDLLLRLVVLAGIVASAALALHLRHVQPNRAYFGTDTRAYQLLAGALLALTPGLVRRLGRFGRWVEVGTWVGVLGLVVLASRLFALDPVERGIAVTLVTLAVLVGLEARRHGPLNRVLSLAPVVFLGQISYGTYLWHWPVVVIAARYMSVRPGFFAVVVAGVASGLAALSAALVELPIRRSAALDRLRWPVVASGLSISVIAALFLVPAVTGSGFARSVTDTARSPEPVGISPELQKGLTPVPAWFDQKKVDEEGYVDRSAPCPTGTPDNMPCVIRRGSGPHVLLLGDSNGMMISGPLEGAAEKADLTLTLGVQNGCPWQLGIDARRITKHRAGCRSSKKRLYADLAEIDPDIVVVMNAFTTQDLGGCLLYTSPSPRD